AEQPAVHDVELDLRGIEGDRPGGHASWYPDTQVSRRDRTESAAGTPTRNRHSKRDHRLRGETALWGCEKPSAVVCSRCGRNCHSLYMTLRALGVAAILLAFTTAATAGRVDWGDYLEKPGESRQYTKTTPEPKSTATASTKPAPTAK